VGSIVAPTAGQLKYVLLCTFLAVFFPSVSRGADEIPVVVDRLPDTVLFCSLVGENRGLLDSLKGKPAIIFATDTAHGADNPLGRLAARLQEEYFYWFTWAGLLAGKADPEMIGKMHAQAPFHFERCFGDREGGTVDSLGLKSLPGIVLVNEDGYIVARVEGDPLGAEPALVEAVDRLARTGTMRGEPVRDFKLPDVETGELLTFLDIAGREYTMLIFLRSGSPICLNELKVLEHVRERYGDRVRLVAVFQDQARREEIQQYLDMCDTRPDVVLHDPRMDRASRYHFRYVPVLLIVGPAGKIVFSHKGYQVERSWRLAIEVDRVLERGKEDRTGSPFQEVRRIHGEAMQYIDEDKSEMALSFLERILELVPEMTTTHYLIAEAYWTAGKRKDAVRHYARYVSANPQAYDLERVKERLREISRTSR
jgi:hypothetical protein